MCRKQLLGFGYKTIAIISFYIRDCIINDREPLDPKLAVGSWIRDWCWENGMILRNNGDILVIAPSLILSKNEADEMLGKVNQAISEAVKHFGL